MKKAQADSLPENNKEILSWCKAAVMDGMSLMLLWGDWGGILGMTACLGVCVEKQLEVWPHCLVSEWQNKNRHK